MLHRAINLHLRLRLLRLQVTNLEVVAFSDAFHSLVLHLKLLHIFSKDQRRLFFLKKLHLQLQLRLFIFLFINVLVALIVVTLYDRSISSSVSPASPLFRPLAVYLLIMI